MSSKRKSADVKSFAVGLGLIVIVVIIIGALMEMVELKPLIETHERSAIEYTEKVEYQIVRRVSDGDTIELVSGMKVRLLGINAPELGQPFALEATTKLRELIGDKKIKLESDVTDKDQYGRLLRYIFVDGLFVNRELLREGYAHLYIIPPNVKYASELRSAEEEARNAERGIWLPSKFAVTIWHIHPDAEGEDNYNLNDEYIVFKNIGNTTVTMTYWTVKDDARHIYTFPQFSLLPNTTVTLHTGEGITDSINLYWGSSEPIWNNDGDTIYLRDRDGYLVDYYRY
jgi:micrococcal nuclease